MCVETFQSYATDPQAESCAYHNTVAHAYCCYSPVQQTRLFAFIVAFLVKVCLFLNNMYFKPLCVVVVGGDLLVGFSSRTRNLAGGAKMLNTIIL